MAKKIKEIQTITYQNVYKEVMDWVNSNSFLFSEKKRWYAGITNDENRRKKEHEIVNNKECKYWRCWDMKTKKIARALESKLHDKGFLNKDLPGNINKDSKYLYVYKMKPTILD